ncbi:MAG: hypothetical protein WBX95_21525, partial [Xanthobacteraceae bacterium]
RLWTDDRDDLQNRRKPSIQLDKEHAIAVRKPDAPMHYPAQHNHLVPERSIFGACISRQSQPEPSNQMSQILSQIAKPNV